MAKIGKPGIDYFPLEVDFMNDRNIRKLIRQHGGIASGSIITLFSAIYKFNGYYLIWNTDTCFDISEQVGIKTHELTAIVKDAVELEIFDRNSFETNGILTSENIQKQYKMCTKKRRNNLIDPRFSLINENEDENEEENKKVNNGSPKVENDSSKAENVPHLPFSDADMPQSKGKESKEKVNNTSSLPSSETGGGSGENRKGKEEKIKVQKETVPDYCRNTATHNYTGLQERLQAIGVRDAKEINYILKMSDYGRIGAPVWKIIAYGKWPRGNVIKMPGKYIIAQLLKTQEGGIS